MDPPRSSSLSLRLGEFVERRGGADDQLFGGSKVSRRLDATLTMRAESGRGELRGLPVP